ncbi:hypothetical protein ONR57_04180 [Hoyosella sp. YIM 151337]|uniref:hypothetical protein n=1 Tax=Hoyosella sp. YIM 151337 TaxID=2992742 RepID=UPI002235727D|nr:hypothetical protein [Hoyosella sp. YIM 151337]MCW4352498.1 hypothetical protein [Hoyosella sp. YIM 151337]
MAHSTASHQTRGSRAAAPSKQVSKRPVVQGRRQLAGAVAMVVFGSFLPWISTAVENVSGVRGPGLWTFYVALLGLAGAVLPAALRRLAGIQAAVMSVVCVMLPVWQLVHVLNLVGTSGWMPGPGLVLVFGGGVLAAVAAARLLRGGDAGDRLHYRGD